MVDAETFKLMALSFPDTQELPHFEMASFRWRNKIFATLRESDMRCMVKLSLIDQDVFFAYSKDVFYPVPGTWGKQGSTFVNLALVDKEMFYDALSCAYEALVNKAGAKRTK
jgi:hypothetical protein